MARPPVSRARPLAEALEARILHSADLSPLLLVPLAGAETAVQQSMLAEAPDQLQRAHEIAFVDAKVHDAAGLIADLQAQRDAGRPIDIIVIGADQDGIRLISETLAARSDVTAVHLLTHGGDGYIQLGNVLLDSRTLLLRAGELADWSAALTVNSDLLLYGCDLAQSSVGEEFVRNLAALTGADVAASTDLTGAAALGGNWTLEYATGEVAISALFESAAPSYWSGLLASLTVTTTSDAVDGNTGSIALLLANKGADGFISLREAIIAANNTAGSDEVIVQAGTYLLSLAGSNEKSALTGDLNIIGNLSLRGAGSAQTIIDGAGIDRVFDLRSGASASFSGMTIRGGAIGSNWGAGINAEFAGGSVTLDDVRITGNSADSGAGIYSFNATLLVNNSTIDGNTGKFGAGFYNDGGAATINRTTISGNNASQDGAGIYNSRNGATLQLNNVTLAGNVAAGSGGALYSRQDASIVNSTIAANTAASGGGIFVANPGTVSLRNTILANNSGGNSSGSLTSLGNNIDSANTAGLTATGDRINTDPLLGVLQYNGGTIKTMAIGAGSAAIDGGTASGAPTVDARGFARVVNDIGAYERNSLVVDTVSDVVDGNTSSIDALLGGRGADGRISLREAVIAANNTTGIDDIVLPAGTYNLSQPGVEDFAASGDLDLRDSVRITGAGAAMTVVSGGGSMAVMQVISGTATISGLTLADGWSSSTAGGLHVNSGATLNLSQAIVRNNSGGDNGAGIVNAGTMTLTDVEVRDNSTSKDGAGIYNFGASLTLNRVTLAGNTGSKGGGLKSVAGTVSLTNVTASNNTGTNKGGGVAIYGGTATLQNVTLADNWSTQGGGLDFDGLLPAGSITLRNVLFANNAGGNIGKDDSDTAALVSLGNNLSTNNSPELNLASDKKNAVADLGAFGDWGGSTRTRPLLAGSAAINNADNASAPATDQRGVARVGVADIGAFESGGAANAAPVLDPSKSPALSPTNKDAGAPIGAVGSLVSSLVDLATPSGQVDNITDADIGALPGIAVTAADTSNGSWFYSIDDGANWNALGAELPGSARLLSADAQTRLYFQPNPAYVGTLANAITIRAWDRSSGLNSNLAGTTINGGSTAFSIATDTVSLVVNVKPVVTTSGSGLAYVENQVATVVDPGLTVADADSVNLSGATVSISANHASGQDQLLFTDQLGITGSWNAATGVMTLSGTATVADYETALRTIAYFNSSDDPGALTRTISFVVNDGIGSSSAATRDVGVTPVNDAPAVTASGSTLAYTENQVATAIDPALTVSDSDDTNLSGATVSISANYASGQDVLAFTNQLGITGSWNAGSGVLTLSGTTTVANYQTALRTVSYFNNSDNPSALLRTVAIVVTDGTAPSVTATRNISVAPVNDAPVVVTSSGTLAYVENQTATVIDAALTVADLDSTNLIGATIRIATNYANGQDVLAFTDQLGIAGSWNAVSGVMTLSGSASVADYQAALRTVSYVNSSDDPSTLNRTIAFVVNDGVANSTAATETVTVAAVVDHLLTVDTANDTTDGVTTSVDALLVNRGADGKISLREAIIAANNTVGVDSINFNIGGGGLQTINLLTALPTITGSVMINGTTQGGFAGVPLIELKGNGLIADGLAISAGNSTVSGLIINGFKNFGIVLSGVGNNVIQGNYIGTNAAGTSAVANQSGGIQVTTANNLIGGTSASQRNVISGNGVGDVPGISISGVSALGNLIQGNYIGINAAGTAGLTNSGSGIDIFGGAGNTTIGGTAAGAGNVISGNDTGSDGIWIKGGSGNVIQGNLIGIDAAGVAAVPNDYSGVYIDGSTDNLIGGTVAGAGNVIAYSTNGGVIIIGDSSSERNSILGNSIYGNVALGIDLREDGVSANDGVKNSSRPNDGMDSPVFTLSGIAGNSLSLGGYVGSAAGQSVFAGSRVEVFVSDADPSGFGEGPTYLGFLTADSSGNFSGVLTVSGVSVGNRITGTATDGVGNTSEFGANRVVSVINMPPVITSNGGGATAAIAMPENSVAVTTVIATDANSDPISYSISGGADAARFTIDASTGVLRFVLPPNYEIPTDVGADNIYNVTVRASDGIAASTQAIAVTVSDVTEALATTGQQLVNAATGSIQETSMNGRGSTRAVAMAPDGAHVIVWSSQNQDGSGWGVYGQRYNAAGAAVGGEFRINQFTTGDQKWVTVAMDASGRFVASWTSANQDGTAESIYARRYNADGSAADNEFRVNTTNSGNQYQSSVGIDASGNFVVVWQGNGPGDTDGIFGRRFSANGTALDAVEFLINTDTALAHYDASVSMNASGAFAVTWDNNAGVQLQSFASSGAAQGGQITVDNGGSAGNGSIALANDGSLVVVWRETTLLDIDIYMRRYNAAGSAIGSAAQVNSFTLLSNQTSPSIAIDSVGNYIVAWEGSGGGDGSGVFGQKFGAAGTAVGGEFRFNSSTTGTQEMVSLAMLDLNNFVAVWSGQGPGDTAGVFTRKYGTLTNAPVITSNGGGETAAINVAENSTTVTTVTATDADLPAQTLVYSIVGGADAARFLINGSTGVLTFAVAPDYELPTDVGTDNVYDVIVRVSDGTLNDEQAIAVTPVNDDTPVITSNGGGASAAINIAENTTAVTTVTATDADLPAQTLSYSISGVDAVRFTINSSTGAVRFAVAPDYELPADVGGDNVYNITVHASDGIRIGNQTLAITVTDVGGPLTVDTQLDDLDGDTSSVEALLVRRGADGKISLREAIIAANNTAGADVIYLPAGNFSLTRVGGNEKAGLTGDLNIVGTLSLVGAGSGLTVVDAAGIDRVFDLRSGANASFSGMTIRGGVIGSNWGAGINAEFAGSSITLNDVRMTGNSGDSGAGIYNYKSTLLINDSTIDGNSGKWGAGIYNDGGSATLNRVTINGNTATQDGAGLYHLTTGASLQLTNVTLSGNGAAGSGGGLYARQPVAIVNSTIAFNNAAAGGGIFIANPGSISLRNSIVAANSGGNANTAVTSLGNNIDSGNTLGLTQPGDRINTGPGLQSLQNNGGLTRTHALLSNSLAIDAANGAAAPATDQRGVARSGAADIGAYEYVGPANAAPAITSNGAGAAASVSVVENSTAVTTVTASDTDLPAQTLLYSITGGADAGKFVINAGTGVLSFATPPNFEAPTDVGADNFYQVVVTASDGALGTNQTISVTVLDVNESPTGLPLITGITTEDQTLTANTSGIADEDGLGGFNYQWLRNGLAISGASASTLVLLDADVGQAISVRVSYLDARGTNESLTSAATAAVANVNDAPTGLPVITGSAVEDQTLTADTGGITDIDGLGSFSFQWLRNGSAISGATGSSLALGDADVGKVISVRISWLDGHATNESLTSAATAAVVNVNDAPTGLPLISGSATENQALSANVASIADADGLGSFSYQWLRGGAAIAGETASTLLLGDADVGQSISVRVSYVDGHGSSEALTSGPTAAVANVNDAPTGLPVISGSALEDQTLSVDANAIADADGLGSFSYQWLRNGTAISGATGTSLLLGDADVGKAIRVRVSYVDGHGTSESVTSVATAAVLNINDTPTGLPTTSGSAIEDRTLAANLSGIADADGLGSFSYQWLRNGSAIGGASASTLLLGDADVGKVISVRVSYTDGNGSAEMLTSAPTAAILNINDPPRGSDSTLAVDRNASRTLQRTDFGFSDTGGESNAFVSVLLQVPSAGSLRLAGTLISAPTEVTVAQLDAGLLVYAPVPGGSGSAYAKIGFQVRDDGGTANGGVDLDPVRRTLTFDIINRAPVISSHAGAANVALGVAENTSLVTTIAATDADGDAPIYSISGGADAARFKVDAASGVLSFVVPPNFEAPLDVGADNVYQVIVRASDGVQTASQAVAVTVGNVVEAIQNTIELPVNLVTADLQETSMINRGSTNAVAMAPNGEHLVVWSSSNQDGAGWGVYAQRFDRAGTGIGSAFLVNQTTSSDQLWASVEMDLSGRAVVTWTSANQDGTSYSVYARRFAADGSADGGEFRVHTTGSGNQYNSTVAVDGNGNFIVVWEGNGPGDGDGIFGRRFRADGSAIDGVEFRINTDTSRTQRDASVAMNASGAFAVIWGNSDGVQMRRYDSAGAALGGQVNVTNESSAGNGSIALADDGNSVVVWRETQLGRAVAMQRFNAAGSTIGGNTVVNSTFSSDQTNPSIAIDGQGNFIVAWEGNGVGDSSGVFAQKFTAAGARVGGEFRLNTTTSGTQAKVSLAMLDLDNLVVVWSGQGAGDADGVFMRQYGALNSSPVLVGSNVLTTTAEDPAINPGTLVSALIAGQLSDVDNASALGIAVIGTDNRYGSWQYSINGGSSWAAFGAVDASSARLLAADGASRIRFVPDAHWNGSVAGGLLFRGWDQSSGTAGATADASQHGGTTAFSSNTAAASITVTPVNDLPVGLPLIVGSAVEDQTLSADLSGISDADGLGGFTYQWLRSGAAISGATGSSLILGDADVGKAIRLRVSYVDNQGNAELLTSAATATVGNVNDLPVGLPVIVGAAVEDNSLIADLTGIADADGLGSFNLQWERDGVAISGATGTSLTLGDADVGKAIGLRVAYIDGHGTTEMLLSAATAPVLNVNDLPSGRPLIVGSAQENNTLTANLSSIADADGLGVFNLQWLRDGAVISGATASSLTLGDADVGRVISLRVDYVDARGTAEQLTSLPSSAVANVNDLPTGLPLIVGVASEDRVLTANLSGIADADGLRTFSLQWLRGGVAIGGATGTSLTLGDADVGQTISLQISYVDGWGTAERLTSAATAPVGNVNDLPGGLPLINGSAIEDQLLVADLGQISDVDGLGSFTLQWQRDGVDISGATGNSLRLGDADVGKLIRLHVSYVDARGTAELLTSAATPPVANVNDLPLGVPMIVGSAIENQILFADRSSISDADGLGAFELQWLRNGTVIVGATGETLSLTDADVGATISVRISYVDGHGTAERLTSAPTAMVADVNDAPTGLPLVTGIAVEDGTLRADLSAIADADGLGAFSLQWLRNGAAISGATGSSLLLGELDGGQWISLRVSYVDGHGNAEVIDSAQIGPVLAVNDAPRLNLPLGDRRAIVGTNLNLAIAPASFTDDDIGDSLSWSVSLVDGRGLPGWLVFDASTGVFSGTPARADLGAVEIRLTATDRDGASASDVFRLEVVLTNQAPVAGPIADQSASQGSAFSFSIPAGAFSDADSGDILTMRASLASGGALPAWLVFDPVAQRFSGTPANGDVGELRIRVTATDLAGMTAAGDFWLRVANVNDAPIATPLADQRVDEDQPFSLNVTGQFSDIDAGDRLRLDARLVSGAALPQWLSFDPASGTFSGTPANGDVGQLDIRITAADLDGASTPLVFKLTVANVNDAPQLVGMLEARRATEGVAFAATIPPGRFIDIDAVDRLVFSATLASGAALPDWLSFDADTLRFHGTPGNTDIGTLIVRLTATDADGASVSGSFRLTVDNRNEAPTQIAALPDRIATQDQAARWTLPADSFVDIDVDDMLSYSAALSSGAALPAWLVFDPATLSFSGTPANANVGELRIRVTVTDLEGASGFGDFGVRVLDVNDAPQLAGANDLAAILESQFTNPGTLVASLIAGMIADIDAAALSGIAVIAVDNSHGVWQFSTDGSNWTDFGPIGEQSARLLAADATTAVRFVPVDRWRGEVSGGLTLRAWDRSNGVAGQTADTTNNAGNSAFSGATARLGITVTPVNHAPELVLPLIDRSAVEAQAFEWRVPPASFIDSDAGDSLTYSATLSNGAALPTWLEFDAVTQTFKGSPQFADIGAMTVRVTATDAAGAAAQSVFVIRVTAAPTVLAPEPVTVPAEAAPAAPAARAEATPREQVPTAEPTDRVLIGADDAGAGRAMAADDVLGTATPIVVESTFRLTAVDPGSRGSSSRPDDDAVLATLPAAQFSSLIVNSPAQWLQNEDMLRKFDDLKHQMQNLDDQQQRIVASSLAISSGLSIGYVVWLVRGGVLVSSMLSALPAWQMIDPMPVLAAAGAVKRGRAKGWLRKAVDGDDHAVEQLFDGHDPRSVHESIPAVDPATAPTLSTAGEAARPGHTP